MYRGSMAVEVPISFRYGIINLNGIKEKVKLYLGFKKRLYFETC
jgi:hypothetical protein